MRKYWVLAVRVDGIWGMEFGSYRRDEVKAEADDLHEGYRGVKRKDLKVVACGARQVDIDAAIAQMNGAAK